MPAWIEITLPLEEAEGAESVVATWFKGLGDAVSINEPLVEVSTSKVSVEIAAPASGILREILKQAGESVAPGEPLGRIEVLAVASSAAEAPSVPSPVASSSANAAATGSLSLRHELSPAVRRLVREHGVDPSQIAGSGKNGRVTATDVESFVAQRAQTSPKATQTATKPATLPATRTGTSRVPHTPMRRGIAQHMVESMLRAPHATSVFEADMTAVMAHRERHKAEFAERDVNLTYTAYFVRASVAALAAVPEVNSRWHDDGLEVFVDHHIGIGTALESGGLIVPVLRGATDLDLFQTAQRLGELTRRARHGGLEPKDVQGGTFTISNHGVTGSLFAAPIIIHQPQSAILGVGKLERRVVATDTGAIHVRPKLYVTLTIDHRVLDGFHANAFLTKWVQVIEHWT